MAGSASTGGMDLVLKAMALAYDCWNGTLKSLPTSMLAGAKCPLDRPPQLGELDAGNDGRRNILRWIMATGEERHNFARIGKLGGQNTSRVVEDENASTVLSTTGELERGVASAIASGFLETDMTDEVAAYSGITAQANVAVPVSKEELGRASWTLLHTLAAQFPDKPTRQQQRDVKELMSILSRLYPCKQCADHFKEVLKSCPVQAGSGTELAQWMCRVHNIVNRSLGKPHFPCERVDARWGALHCDEGACDLQGRSDR